MESLRPQYTFDSNAILAIRNVHYYQYAKGNHHTQYEPPPSKIVSIVCRQILNYMCSFYLMYDILFQRHINNLKPSLWSTHHGQPLYQIWMFTFDLDFWVPMSYSQSQMHIIINHCAKYEDRGWKKNENLQNIMSHKTNFRYTWPWPRPLTPSSYWGFQLSFSFSEPQIRGSKGYFSIYFFGNQRW